MSDSLLDIDHAQFTSATNALIRDHYRDDLGYECLDVEIPAPGVHFIENWVTSTGTEFYPVTPDPDGGGVQTFARFEGYTTDGVTINIPDNWDLVHSQYGVSVGEQEAKRLVGTAETVHGTAEKYSIPETTWRTMVVPVTQTTDLGKGTTQPHVDISVSGTTVARHTFDENTAFPRMKYRVEQLLAKYGPSSNELAERRDAIREASELFDVPGMTLEDVEVLYSRGIESVDDLASVPQDELAHIINSRARAARFKAHAGHDDLDE